VLRDTNGTGLNQNPNNLPSTEIIGDPNFKMKDLSNLNYITMNDTLKV